MKTVYISRKVKLSAMYGRVKRCFGLKSNVLAKRNVQQYETSFADWRGSTLEDSRWFKDTFVMEVQI